MEFMTKDELELIETLTRDFVANQSMVERIKRSSDKPYLLDLIKSTFNSTELQNFLLKGFEEKLKYSEYALAQFTGTKTDKL